MQKQKRNIFCMQFHTNTNLLPPVFQLYGCLGTQLLQIFPIFSLIEFVKSIWVIEFRYKIIFQKEIADYSYNSIFNLWLPRKIIIIRKYNVCRLCTYAMHSIFSYHYLLHEIFAEIYLAKFLEWNRFRWFSAVPFICFA